MGHDHDTDGTNRHRARRRRAGAAIVGLAALALLATACGGGSKSPGVASAGGTTTATASASGPSGPSGSTTTAQPASSPGSSSSSGPTNPSVPGSSGEVSQSQQLQFAQCMRSHGVLDFPDPSPSRGFLSAISASGINTHSSTFQAALQACKKYNPDGNMAPAQSAAENTRALQFSQCMRSHGVPNFPDPSTGPVGEQVIDLRRTGIDLSSPTFQAASEACQKIVPGSK
jgi:hypothetical protein